MLNKLRGRSKEEWSFRAQQEFFNALYFVWAPSPGPAPEGPLPILPPGAAVAAKLKGTPYAAEVERLAGEVLAHRFPLLGGVVEIGAEIDWRRDYPNGVTSKLAYWRTVPYLDASVVGDHKNVWELNRHQHLVLLAQAFLLTGKREYVNEVFAQLESWLAANPFQRGINWTSALEVAFRALSWIWVWHLVSGEMDPALRKRFWAMLYRHGCYLERNLSTYFSPNTHLLGEAVALHALAVLFPAAPDAARWQTLGATVVRAQLDTQVRDDGSHYEQSTYYHVYALDMFLFHLLLLGGDVEAAFTDKVRKMAEYADALLGVEKARAIECFGDDDGGRFFHPYGDRTRFGRGSMAVAAALVGNSRFYFTDPDWCEMAAWWTARKKPEPAAKAFAGTRVFGDAGMAVLAGGETQLCFKYGGMGHDQVGHSHADGLSVTLRHRGERLLADPGTFTYVGDVHWRDWFRNTAAHNTVLIDGLNQAVSQPPFRWSNRPESGLTAQKDNDITAWCRYGGFTHRRRVVWRSDARVVLIEDVVEGGDVGEHQMEQVWHPGVSLLLLSPACFQLGERAKLWANPETSREFGEAWLSPVFGVKEPAMALRVRIQGKLPLRLVAALDLDGTYESWQPEWSTLG